MKISLNWLKSYIETSLPAEEIAKILTDIGLEVEGLEQIETVRGGLSGLVVGEVLTCEKHPDADKLHVTTVDLGDGVPTQIVCGAPNVAAGQKVVVATINTMLYPTGEAEGFKIKKSKIRGVESLGMLCAEDEIGIGTSHDGIIVLPNDVPAGTPARDYYQIEDDYLLEIGLTPNRADAMSHYGVARDLAVYLQANGIPHRLVLPDVSAFREGISDKEVAVEVLNTEAAPRYMGITVTGVKVAESPEWLQNRLRSIGLNPHNNIVDITNFILHEVGQPLHAFDAGKIKGGKVIVRTCPEGTPFVTLDGVERKLSDKDLMICDTEKPMCIRNHDGRIHRERLFQSGLDSQKRQTPRVEHRCLVPFRTRDRSGDSALCVETGSPADGGIGGRKGQLPGNGPLSRSGATFPVRHFAQPRQTTDGQRCAG